MRKELTKNDIITALAYDKELKIDDTVHFVIQRQMIDDVCDTLQNIIDAYMPKIPWYLNDEGDVASTELINKIQDNAAVQLLKLINAKNETEKYRVYKLFKLDRNGDLVLNYD